MGRNGDFGQVHGGHIIVLLGQRHEPEVELAVDEPHLEQMRRFFVQHPLLRGHRTQLPLTVRALHVRAPVHVEVLPLLRQIQLAVAERAICLIVMFRLLNIEPRAAHFAQVLPLRPVVRVLVLVARAAVRTSRICRHFTPATPLHWLDVFALDQLLAVVYLRYPWLLEHWHRVHCHSSVWFVCRFFALRAHALSECQYPQYADHLPLVFQQQQQPLYYFLHMTRSFDFCVVTLILTLF